MRQYLEYEYIYICFRTQGTLGFFIMIMIILSYFEYGNVKVRRPSPFLPRLLEF